jgi:hypothetical protein
MKKPAAAGFSVRRGDSSSYFVRLIVTNKVLTMRTEICEYFAGYTQVITRKEHPTHNKALPEKTHNYRLGARF